MRTKENRYSSMQEYVREDWKNTLDFAPESAVRRFNSFSDKPLTGDDISLVEDELPVSIFPSWYWEVEPEDMTEEQEEELHKCMSEAAETYTEEWDSIVDEYLQSCKNNKEKRIEDYLDQHEEVKQQLFLDYECEKKDFENRRDSYYGYCMNGGGGRKEFHKSYSDGNFLSFNEWAYEKVFGEEQ